MFLHELSCLDPRFLRSFIQRCVFFALRLWPDPFLFLWPGCRRDCCATRCISLTARDGGPQVSHCEPLGRVRSDISSRSHRDSRNLGKAYKLVTNATPANALAKG